MSDTATTNDKSASVDTDNGRMFGSIITLIVVSVLIGIWVATATLGGRLSDGSTPYLKTDAAWIPVVMLLTVVVLAAIQKKPHRRASGSIVMLIAMVVTWVMLWIGHSNNVWAFRNVAQSQLEGADNTTTMWTALLFVPIAYLVCSLMLLYTKRWLWVAVATVLLLVVAVDLLFLEGSAQCFASSHLSAQFCRL